LISLQNNRYSVPASHSLFVILFLAIFLSFYVSLMLRDAVGEEWIGSLLIETDNIIKR